MHSRVLYWNANGLQRNRDALTSLLTCPRPINNEAPIDIVTLVETHIPPELSCPPMRGYNSWSRHHAGNSGGVAVYVRDSLIARGIPEYDYYDREGGSSAALWVSVRPFQRSRTEMLVAVVYVQPSSSTSARVKTSAGQLYSEWSTLIRIKPIIIAGDFNSRDPLWGDTVNVSHST